MQIYSTQRIHEGRVLNLRLDEIDSYTGGKRRVEVVEHVGGVGIIAQPTPSSIVLVRQYRHAVGQYLWEIPAGMIDRGEDPVETARRELIEETGFRAQGFRQIRVVFPSPGFCNERIHIFLAEGLTVGEAQPEDDERIEIRVWDLDEAWALVERDELLDGKTQIALAWAQMNRRF
ncbi:MAG TPA: NUDIX hydrolase [Candidatus Baltobacteraceae bacterium]|nr:NUDIX hydrolase [Candidatus Baltobacteraceae bacterium]